MTIRTKWIAGVIIGFPLIFCISFVYFYTKAQQRSLPVDFASPAMSKALPAAELIDRLGIKLDDRILRRGKVMLVFVSPECNACDTESEFLKTVLEKRNDISFYGISFIRQERDCS